MFSREDYFTVRRLRFIQSVLIDAHAGGRIFYGLRALTNGESLYPLLEALVNETYAETSPFGQLLDDFKAASDTEFVTDAELADQRYAGDGERKSLKLNPYFLSKLIYDGTTLEDFFGILQLKITGDVPGGGGFSALIVG